MRNLNMIEAMTILAALGVKTVLDPQTLEPKKLSTYLFGSQRDRPSKDVQIAFARQGVRGPRMIFVCSVHQYVQHALGLGVELRGVDDMCYRKQLGLFE